MSSPLHSIARFTLIEARRARVVAVTLALCVLAAGAAEFAASLALTDTASYRTATYASVLRTGLVGLVALVAVAGVVRERDERWLELTLSRPVSRGTWYAGRLLGFAALALALALAACAPLLLFAPPACVAAWGASLATELTLVAAASLSFAVTLRSVTASLATVAGFYVLSRVMHAIVLMSTGPGADPSAWTTPVVAKLVAGLALVLPALDRFTLSVWLETPPTMMTLGAVLVQGVVYTSLLAAIGLFDFHRGEV